MNVLPIQVTEEAVLIPHHYLHGADEFEVEVVDGYVVLRPKVNAEQPQRKENWLAGIAGIAVTKDPTASERVEEILAEEMGKRPESDE